jgi:diguanylate cyclase
VTAALAALALAALVYLAHVAVGLGGRGGNHVWNHWVYDGVIGGAALMCLLRARRGRDRLAWGSIGLAISLYWLGDLYWNNYNSHLAHPPYPSWADAGWLAYYLPLYAGMLLLLRARVSRLALSTWLEGLVGALALGSVAASVLFDPVVASTRGDAATVATNLAYPTLDVLMIAFVAGAIAVMRRGTDAPWLLLGLGLLVATAADSAYLVQAAAGTYDEGGFVNGGWPLAMTLIAFAAWTPSRARDRHADGDDLDGSVMRLLDGSFALLIFAVVAAEGFWHVPLVAHVLVTLAVLALFARVTLAGYERRQLERRIAEAGIDELTGLVNRHNLYEQIDSALARGRRTALLFVDLDRFVELRDTLGREIGDELLRQTAVRLRGAIPAGALLARVGADDFFVLLDALERGSADALARSLHDALDEPFPLDGLLVTVTASIGIAVAGVHASTRAELLRCADVAMCRARARKTRVECYSDENEQRMIDRLRLVSELRLALRSEQFVLHYQPKVAIRGRHLVGVEALVRWQHPRLGLLGPVEFVPLVESEGLMRLLTLQVLDLALAQQRAWRTAGIVVPVAVNLSPSNLMDARLPIDVKLLLERHDAAPERLELEITEETLTRDPHRALDVIARIGELGVEFSLDDFGTGYSSLAQLRRLPVRSLKIDRSFIANMTDNDEDANIVRSTVQLARSLGLRVVAEGVERVEHVHALERCGCDVAQGFYFSEPLPADALGEWLRAGRHRRGAALGRVS